MTLDFCKFKRTVLPYEKYKEKSGKECLEFLIEKLRDHFGEPPTIFIHSMNTVGRNYMYDLLKNNNLVAFNSIELI